MAKRCSEITVDSAPNVPHAQLWCMSCCRVRSKLPLITHLRLAPKICLVGSQKYSPLCVICRLLVFAEWIRGARRGRDSKWITLPLNKPGKKKKKREDVCFRKSQDRTREACFLYPLFKQPYSCCNSPSILVHSGGDSISILVPLFALPISSFFRCVGPLVSFFLFYKVSKNGDLVPLICILNSQRGKKSEKGSFCKTAGRLKGIRASIHVSAAEWHLVTKNAIFIIWRL